MLEKRWEQNGGKEKDKIRQTGLKARYTKEQIMTLSENCYVISTALNIGLHIGQQVVLSCDPSFSGG